MAMTGKNRIMIYGPKNDGTYVVEFRTAAGETLAIFRRQQGADASASVAPGWVVFGGSDLLRSSSENR